MSYRQAGFAIRDFSCCQLPGGVPCSLAEFIAKIGVVVEEADETVFWLELLVETNIVSPSRMNSLLDEANELLAIFAASQHMAKRK